MTLAKELVERGQSAVVLQYLALCKNFWKMDRGKLDEWSATNLQSCRYVTDDTDKSCHEESN